MEVLLSHFAKKRIIIMYIGVLGRSRKLKMVCALHAQSANDRIELDKKKKWHRGDKKGKMFGERKVGKDCG